MKSLKFIFVILAVSIFVSCEKDDDVAKSENMNMDYLIFGHYYGMCEGENCIEIFKLTETTLFEDQNDDLAMNDFSFSPLGEDKFDLVNGLMENIPAELYQMEEDFIGCPDCADGGGLYIEYSIGGNSDSFRIDQIKDSVPTFLHPFMDEVSDKISLINS